MSTQRPVCWFLIWVVPSFQRWSHQLWYLPEVARLLYPRPGVAYVEVTDLEPWTIALAWRPEDRDAPGVAALRWAARTALGGRAPWDG
ncbi:hypothetical protein AB0L25_26935 [Spirillospora sp. NPDC052242]